MVRYYSSSASFHGAGKGGGRVPKYCPPGFGGRYTVVSGDTMYIIAQR